jgi:hypothetical protein
VCAVSALCAESGSTHKRAEPHLWQLANESNADHRPALGTDEYWRWNEREVKRQQQRRKWEDMLP